MEIIEGQVVSGLGVGKKIGFPTINILYDGKLSGVFAGKVFIGEKPKIVTAAMCCGGAHKGHDVSADVCACGGACLCSSEQNKKGFLAAVHIGKRPTISENEPILEAYIVDGFEKFAQKKLIGRIMKVEILKKIRDTEKFKNLEELKKQIADDVELIKNHL